MQLLVSAGIRVELLFYLRFILIELCNLLNGTGIDIFKQASASPTLNLSFIRVLFGETSKDQIYGVPPSHKPTIIKMQNLFLAS